jgi:hypothetical protein
MAGDSDSAPDQIDTGYCCPPLLSGSAQAEKRSGEEKRRREAEKRSGEEKRRREAEKRSGEEKRRREARRASS